jgi:hypothetical protein
MLPGGEFSTLVVTDSPSMPDAARLLDGYAARGESAPAVAFSIDHSGLQLTSARAG